VGWFDKSFLAAGQCRSFLLSEETMLNLRSFGAVVAMLLATSGCSSDGTDVDAGEGEVDASASLPDAAGSEPDAGPQDEKPVVKILSPRPGAGAQGSISIEVNATDDLGVKRIEIYAQGREQALAGQSSPSKATVKLTASVASLPDGLATVYARALDTSGQLTDSAPITLVVYNQGQEADLGGADGEMYVPADYDPAQPVEIDTKHHWDNPDGIHSIVGVLDWQVPQGSEAWNLGLSVGIGECPHSGRQLSQEPSATEGPIIVQAKLTKTADIVSGLHFIHVRPIDPLNHKGQSLPYTVHVFLFP
jgi:hypothetical protein